MKLFLYPGFRDRVASIREYYDGIDIDEAVFRYQLACLPLLQSFFTDDVSRRAYETACRYWNEGDISTEDLRAARCSCWDYAKTIAPTSEDRSCRELYMALRALHLCSYSDMENEEDWDAVECLLLYLQFTIEALGWDGRLEINLYKYFPRLKRKIRKIWTATNLEY